MAPQRNGKLGKLDVSYFSELCTAMEMLAAEPRSIFLGQAVACEGTGISKSFANVPREKLLELPVAEEMQMGMSIGLSLDGMLPVSVYPRWNFLILAASQLVNHLDKIPIYSGYRPRVIIRVAVPTAEPLNPGPQHLGNYANAFRSMLHTVRVIELHAAEEIVPAYAWAMRFGGSAIMVEFAGNYNK